MAASLTRELNEAREHQAATSEVLKAISSSQGDLQQVFATMLQKAVRICDAKFGNIYRWDGDALHLMASHNIPATRSPNLPGPQTPTGEKEPGALAYEYTVGSDQKTVDIYERYTNAHAAVVHVTENFGPNFSKEFMALAKPERFVVYTAAPTDELKKTLAELELLG